MWPRLRSLWRNTVHRRRADRDLDDEIAVAFDLVTPSDPRIFAACVACLFAVAMLAAAVPAWRASKVEPLAALRQG